MPRTLRKQLDLVVDLVSRIGKSVGLLEETIELEFVRAYKITGQRLKSSHSMHCHVGHLDISILIPSCDPQSLDAISRFELPKSQRLTRSVEWSDLD